MQQVINIFQKMFNFKILNYQFKFTKKSFVKFGRNPKYKYKNRAFKLAI